MRSILNFALALIIASAALILADAAHAQSRTWVSGVGDDLNPCTRVAPCKTFAGAISKTATKGEINCLDPGGFGGVTITKAISIVCYNTMGGILSAGANAIIVNILNPDTGDRVMIDGLDIDGAGTGVDGIRVLSGAKIIVRNTVIRGFQGHGIVLNSPTAPRLILDGSVITATNIGLNFVQPAGVIVERTRFENNLVNSVKITNGSTVILNQTSMAGPAVDIDIAAGASVVSYGTNVIRGSGTPTSTIPLK